MKRLILVTAPPVGDPGVWEVPEPQIHNRAKEIAARAHPGATILVYDHQACHGKQRLQVLYRWNGKELV